VLIFFVAIAGYIKFAGLFDTARHPARAEFLRKLFEESCEFDVASDRHKENQHDQIRPQHPPPRHELGGQLLQRKILH
ncbi:MAG: hypothetical protein AAFW75_22300, partial [Cyanobacteria bacterium J06636_16]